MNNYYSQKLSAERLRQCYDVAPPKTKAYLKAELEFVLERCLPSFLALELGCGYGRILAQLASKVRAVVGIDTSISSLQMAQRLLSADSPIHLAAMDAGWLSFHEKIFDLTICIQNGISAFKIDPQQLIAESIRVTRSGGTVLFSTYSDKFWPHRLEWFEAQAAHGLVGAIDYDLTRPDKIICKDGFTATTAAPQDFALLAANLNLIPNIIEVAESSLFCVLHVP